MREWGGNRYYGLNRLLREGLIKEVMVWQRGEKRCASPGEMWGRWGPGPRAQGAGCAKALR